MRTLLLLVVIVIAVFLGYPLLSEDTGSECNAAERAFIRVKHDSDDKDKDKDKHNFGLLLGELAQGLCNGKCAYALAEKQYQHVPASAGCAMLFWRATIDPKGFEKSLTDSD